MRKNIHQKITMTQIWTNHSRLMEEIINEKLDVKLGQFMEDKLDAVPKSIKSRAATGLFEIPPEVLKTEKFNKILIWLCNAVYEQNTI